MDINQQKEQFSSNFVRVVAAVAGHALYKPEVDEDSVDWGIVAKINSNQFTVEALSTMIQRIGEGGFP